MRADDLVLMTTTPGVRASFLLVVSISIVLVCKKLGSIRNQIFACHTKAACVRVHQPGDRLFLSFAGGDKAALDLVDFRETSLPSFSCDILRNVAK